MSTRQSSLMRTPAASATSPAHSGLLQRKCACGKAAGPTGECEECKKKRESGPMLQRKSTGASSQSSTETPSIIQEPRFGYDFSRVPVHADSRHSSQSGLHVDGSLSVHPPPEENSIIMDEPPKAKPAPEKPAPAKAACPPTIEVASILDADLSEDHVKAGFLTGVGGVAEIRVSDPTGKDWAGTVIHENIKPATNTCKGLDNCTNAGGVGGAGGSTWKVGEAVTGMVNLPGKKNTFYDLHLSMVKYSVLHDKGLDTCTQTCEQYFDCPGVGRIGTNTFTLKRVFNKGKVGGKDVSLITLTES